MSGWWRRDPSLWCRSPHLRCSRRVIRDDDGLLRARSFSASKLRTAQHRDDDDSKRPAGLSSSDWVKLQHYRRWRRQVQEDPYRALFGASNYMLNGKGLRAWERLHTAFPKWMTKGMQFPEDPEDPKRQGKPRRDEEADSKFESTTNHPPEPTANRGYPRKVNITETDQIKTKSRSPAFERVGSASGVVSPSDPRRPRENVESAESYKAEQSTVKDAPTDEGAQLSQKEATSRESTFIKEFLADAPSADRSTDGERNDWRQTVLDRRLDSKATNTPRTIEESEPILEGSKEASTSATRDFEDEAGSTPVSENNITNHIEIPNAVLAASNNLDSQEAPNNLPKEDSERLFQLNESDDNHSANIDVASRFSRSTADVLSQLPKDDLDFLTADDIRASIGAKRRMQESIKENEKSRAELENRFEDALEHDLELHPMVEAKILNDQQIRRTTKGIETDEKTEDVPEAIDSITLRKTSESSSIPVVPEHVESIPTAADLDSAKDNARAELWASSEARKVKSTVGAPDTLTEQSSALDDAPVRDDALGEYQNRPIITPQNSAEESQQSPPFMLLHDDVEAKTSAQVPVSEAEPASLKESEEYRAIPDTAAEQLASAAVQSEEAHQTSAGQQAPSPTISKYKILSYDPSTDELYITTTSSNSSDTTTPIPMHEALAKLDAPAKFVRHISPDFEIVTSKPNLLILRERDTPNAEILDSLIHNENEVREEEWKRINPIDGTSRLSPTGFVGVEPDFSDEHDASQRQKYYDTWLAENEKREEDKPRDGEVKGKKKKKGSVASVFKTAIMASAVCYVAGVIGETMQ